MKPLSLSRLPTPIQPLPGPSDRLGVELWVKRDDLTGAGLSGNKVRKLDHLLARARAEGATCVITTGGIQSNHCRATAVAARRLGLDVHLLLRGAPVDVPDANLLLDELLGARVSWCDAEAYRTSRDALMADIAAQIAADGGCPYVIPEGGSNGLGALAYVDAARELADQAREPFDVVAVAVGSGGTVAGLALGEAPGPVRGVAVCDDAAYFTGRVRAIAADAASHGAPALREPGASWSIVDGYQGPGYALADAPVWEAITLAARTEGLLFDPVYTGKMLHAVISEVRAGRWGGRVLLWHTGGAFGLFGRGAELRAHLAS
jgi:D-cysteine desulfhydrase